MAAKACYQNEMIIKMLRNIEERLGKLEDLQEKVDHILGYFENRNHDHYTINQIGDYVHDIKMVNLEDLQEKIDYISKILENHDRE